MRGRRLWALTTRQTVFAFAAAVIVGILVALVLGTGGDRHPAAERSTSPSASSHGVWVFGFDTLRFDLALRHFRQLDETGFGAVQGTAGRVYLYDAGTGRVGQVDGHTNKVTTLGTIPHGTAEDNTFLPIVAPLGSNLWLATAPGELTRFDLSSRRAGPPVDVTAGPDPVHRPVASGVVASSHVVYAVTQERDGLALARIDPDAATVRARGHVALEPSLRLDGIATDGPHLWVVASGNAFEVDGETLAVTRRVVIAGAGPNGVKGAVTAGGALWVLADHGGSIARLAPETGALDIVVRMLRSTPGRFRTPASLVTDGTRVWGMVQRRADRSDHSVRIVGYDTATRKPTRGVDLPSALFAGAAAAT